MEILDFLFPKRCIVCKRAGSYLCENCLIKLSFDTKPLCLICKKPSFNNLTHLACKKNNSIDGCFSAISFNKTAQKLIYKFKDKVYLKDLETLLGDLFYESIIQNENFNKELGKGKWVFVPVPLYSLVLQRRGYNQSEILVKNLANRFNFTSVNILKRIKNTPIKTKKTNLERRLNMKNAFIFDNQRLKNKISNIFLVDDVVITGVTLKEAATVLKQGGVKRVIGLTLARG